MRVKDLIEAYSSDLTASAGKPQASSVIARHKRFLDDVSALEDPEAEIRSALMELLGRREFSGAVLWLASAGVHLSQEYVDALCGLLSLEQEDIPNEIIVDLLIELKSPKSIPVLIRALKYDFPSDPFMHLQVKILEALSEFDDDAAERALRDSLKSQNEIIREEARLLLYGE